MSKTIELTQTQLNELINKAVEEAVKPLAQKVTVLAEAKAKAEAEEQSDSKVAKVVQSWSSYDPEEVAERTKEMQAKFLEKIRKSGKIPYDEFSFVRYIRAKMTGNWKHAPFEKMALEASAEIAQKEGYYKTLSYGGGTAEGSDFVAGDFLADEFFTYYGAKVVARKAGCTVLQATGAPVQIPKVTDAPSTEWLNNEGDAINADTAMKTAQLQLNPHWCVGRVQLTQFLVRSSELAAETIVRRILGEELARAVDDAILEGSDSGGQPCGIANVTGVNSVTAGSAAITFDKLRDFMKELEIDNVPLEGCAWFMHPRTWYGILGFVKNSESNNFVINPTQQEAYAPRLYGIPVYTTSNITVDGGTGNNEATIILARVPDIILCEWGGLELASTSVGGDAWAKHLVEVKAVYTMDVGLINPESVCVCKDTTT